MLVQFYIADTKITLKERTKLKGFIISIFLKEGKKINYINYILCSDEYLLSINREFLKHDYYTDIITFNLSGIQDPINGEVYISIDRIRENAKNLQVSIKSEFHRVIFHGALHLCGYKDKKRADKQLMRKQEDKYLNSYFK